MKGRRLAVFTLSRCVGLPPILVIVALIAGYTLANDVSAWDIERENPLYLPQSKVYTGCCALGPWFVTVDELANPYALDMACTIHRAGELLFEGRVEAAQARLATLKKWMVGEAEG